MPSQSESVKKYGILALVLGLVIASAALWALFRWSNYGPWIAPPEAKSLANPVSMNATTIAAGKSIYADHCARCHGDQGNGDGPDASMYKTPPGVLSDARVMGQQTDGEIFWKIGEGRRPMPSFAKELTDEQRWELVNYIRSLAKPTPSNPAASAPPTPPAKN